MGIFDKIKNQFDSAELKSKKSARHRYDYDFRRTTVFGFD